MKTEIFFYFFLQETVCGLYCSYNFKSALQNRLLHLHMNQQWSQSLLQAAKIWETSSKLKRETPTFSVDAVKIHNSCPAVFSTGCVHKDKAKIIYKERPSLSWLAHSIKRKISRKQHRLILTGISSGAQNSDKECKSCPQKDKKWFVFWNKLPWHSKVKTVKIFSFCLVFCRSPCNWNILTVVLKHMKTETL